MNLNKINDISDNVNLIIMQPLSKKGVISFLWPCKDFEKKKLWYILWFAQCIASLSKILIKFIPMQDALPRIRVTGDFTT